MSYRATATYTCDGCKVVESGEIELLTDLAFAKRPNGWLRIQSGRPENEETTTRHYCLHCSGSIESYLAGRLIDEDEARGQQRQRLIEQFDRWQIKATTVLGAEVVRTIIDDSLKVE